MYGAWRYRSVILHIRTRSGTSRFNFNQVLLKLTVTETETEHDTTRYDTREARFHPPLLVDRDRETHGISKCSCLPFLCSLVTREAMDDCHKNVVRKPYVTSPGYKLRTNNLFHKPSITIMETLRNFCGWIRQP
jgi:hypothetical protein